MEQLHSYQYHKVQSSTTQPYVAHCWIFFLKCTVANGLQWLGKQSLSNVFQLLKYVFQFRHAKHFYWLFLLLKNMSNFGVKDWLWNVERMDRLLNFELFSSFSKYIKFCLKLYSNATGMSFLLNSCLSHIVSIIGWKINVVVKVRTCYQTLTTHVFLNN
jgi:hypothetical protein